MSGAETARIGRYRVVALVHEGEQSRVYRCREPALQREVAVKVARQDIPDPARARRRLLVEARLRAANLHPAVVPLYRLLRTAAGPALVGPWLPATPLIAAVGQGTPLAPSLVLALATEIGGALDALHAAGWWHGDVTPANILIGTDGRLVLTDFGTARRLGERPFDGRTLFTTPLFTAPEVWEGCPVQPASDLYSLAVLLYTALTGRYPFAAESPEQIRELHRTAEPPWPADLSPAVRAVLARGLAKEPAARFGSGAELAAALRAALDPAPRASPETEATGARLFRLAQQQSTPEGAAAGALAQLQRFAAGLSEQEQVALHVLFGVARRTMAQAVAASADITMRLLAPAAALLALDACGAARRLAERARTVDELAAVCRVPVRPLRRVLAVLAELGVVTCDAEQRYALVTPLALASTDPFQSGASAGPIAQAAAFWGHLPRWVQTGVPYRQMDRPDGAAYADVIDLLDALHAEAAGELAQRLRAEGLLPAGAAILDVGAGSAIWSRALASFDADATIAAVDRGLVLEAARAYAEAAGMGHRFTAIAGDWRDAPFPAGAYDLAILANICHLEDETEAPRLLSRAVAALRPGGLIVVVDTIPDESQGPKLEALLQALQLGLRTPAGGIYTLQQYRAWLAEAGCQVMTTWPLEATGGRLTALLARRG